MNQRVPIHPYTIGRAPHAIGSRIYAQIDTYVNKGYLPTISHMPCNECGSPIHDEINASYSENGLAYCQICANNRFVECIICMSEIHEDEAMRNKYGYHCVECWATRKQNRDRPY